MLIQGFISLATVNMFKMSVTQPELRFGTTRTVREKVSMSTQVLLELMILVNSDLFTITFVRREQLRLYIGEQPRRVLVPSRTERGLRYRTVQTVLIAENYFLTAW